MRYLSMRVKILIILMSLMLFFGLSMAIFAKTVFQHNLLAEMQKKAIVLAKQTALDCVNPVLTQQYFELELMFKDIQVEEPDVLYAFVLNEEKKVLASTFGPGVPAGLKEANVVNVVQPYSTREMSTDKGMVLDIGVPLLHGQIGVMRMGISEKGVRRDVHRMVLMIILFSLCVMVLGGSIAIWFSRALTKPLMELAGAVAAFGRGEIHNPIAINSGDEIGDLTRIFNTMVEKRKQAEEAVRKSEEQYRQLFNSIRDAILITDSERKILGCNPAFITLFGYTLNEIVGKSTSLLFVHDEQFIELGELAKNHVGDNPLIYPISYRKKNGETFPGEVALSFFIDARGNTSGFIGLIKDITDRKRAEEKLKKRDRQLRESQEVAKLGNWDLDLVSQTLEWSDETYKLFGRSPKNYVPSFDAFARVVHPDDRSIMETNFSKALESDANPYHAAIRIVNESGREWVMEAFGVVRRDPSGTALSIFGTAQDITERKQAEEKIQQSEYFIRNILDTVDEGFIVIDREYRIQTANKAYAKLVGSRDKETVGQHCYELSHKTNRPCYEEGEDCAPRRVFETGKPHAALHRHKDGAGNMLYVETKAFPIKDESGAVISVIETINNITEKHLLEEERLKTQKLESIGTLAGGIAHDFNNLLQGVFGYISLAKMVAKNPEKSTAALEQAEKALHLSVNLTTQLLTFSKGGKPAKKEIDLRPVIENSAMFTLSGSRSDLRLDIPEKLWHADADAGQLGQVIQNIVLNADQAMPLGGTINITAANVAEGASLPTGLAKGNYVMIEIQDTGAGIPEKYFSKIFDPYFTTKEKGSGLGLATSYSIVKNHGGMIDVRTKYGQGTTFMIYLPALARQLQAAAAEKPQEPARQHHARILVMDDEDFIRDLSSEILGMLGHEVEVAKHGEEAVEKYQKAMAAGKPFDLVILDLTVRGGMGGLETMQRLIVINPAVKAVVSSGYSDDSATAEYEKQGFKAFLKKPYDVDALREVLNKVLGR